MSNLANVAAPGNTRAVTHGAWSEELAGPIAAEVDKLLDELLSQPVDHMQPST
jgi:hypothetical protein